MENCLKHNYSTYIMQINKSNEISMVTTKTVNLLESKKQLIAIPLNDCPHCCTIVKLAVMLVSTPSC